MHTVATKEREEMKGTTKQMARRHSRERGNHLEQESNRQKAMEVIDVGLHLAMDGQSRGRGGGGGGGGGGKGGGGGGGACCKRHFIACNVKLASPGFVLLLTERPGGAVYQREDLFRQLPGHWDWQTLLGRRCGETLSPHPVSVSDSGLTGPGTDP